MNELYFAEGILNVYPQGYWFTSGGTKTSFGFYPHLKSEGMPIYPDTQITGNLRTAIRWYLKLTGQKTNLERYYFGDLSDESDRKGSSKIFISDLVPINKNFEFQILPRIEVTELRTAKKDMLVNFECAYFKSQSRLSGRFYTAYFKNQEDLDNLLELIQKATSLFVGFGAFRSRGFGRGKIKFEFKKGKVDLKAASIEKKEELEEITIVLKPLVNFRNRQIESGTRQIIPISYCISSNQIRSWFIKTYYDIFNIWPSYEEMRQICFTDFYPSIYDYDEDTVYLGLPVPSTTMRLEDGTLLDTWIATVKEKPDFSSKPKPLSQNFFVTAEEHPRLIELKIQRRVRNSMNPDFSTKEEGGLFSQEFITTENYFGGKITVSGNNEFANRAVMIIKELNLRPIINGAIFEKYIPKKVSQDIENTQNPHLVRFHLNLEKSIIELLSSEQDFRIRLTNMRRYNAVLGRPRRNRIAVSTGSILPKSYGRITFQWTGFGGTISIKESTTKDDNPIQKDEEIALSSDLSRIKITRSQAGQLVEMLSPHVSKEIMERMINERLEKYKQWTKDIEKIEERLIPTKILKKIQELLKEDDGLNKARSYIKAVIENFKISEWEQNEEKIKKNLKRNL